MSSKFTSIRDWSLITGWGRGLTSPRSQSAAYNRVQLIIEILRYLVQKINSL